MKLNLLISLVCIFTSLSSMAHITNFPHRHNVRQARPAVPAVPKLGPNLFYYRQLTVPNQCGYSYYNNWGQCVQNCNVALWNKVWQTRTGYVLVHNAYGYPVWQLVGRTGWWWYYTLQTRVFPSRNCF